MILRTGILGTAATFVAAVFLSASSAHAAIQVRWKADPADTNRTVVEATGLPKKSLQALAKADWSTAQWQALFSAVTETGNLATDLNLPALSGSYQVNSDTLRFSPSFPLTAGVTYRATLRPSSLPGSTEAKSASISAAHKIAATISKPTTVVSALYPTAGVLPENLLKFYLHFSAPMSRGHTYDHIQLLDVAGKPVELPFLEIDEELWNPEMTRLTLFLDPGRIKRGVKPLEEVGPSLEEGRSYTLVIGSGWLDATGTPLRDSFRKKFSVGVADREPPDPARWKLDAPAAKSKAALKLAFPEPLDHGIIERVFRVLDSSGKPVAGTVTVGAEELSWSFVPAKPWRAGRYQVTLPATIEDLAGNNVGKPFEVDLFERVDRRLTNSLVELPFAVN